MLRAKKILFITTMGGSPWGGSEELWAQSASVLLRRGGYEVYVCTKKWPSQSPQVKLLSDEGAKISHWSEQKSLKSRLCNKLLPRNEFATVIKRIGPDIVVNSNGAHVPSVQLAQSLLESGNAYMTLCQANSSEYFFSDEVADLYARFFDNAALNAFVAQSNLKMLEAQIGMCVPRSTVVRNPVGRSLRAKSLPIPMPEPGGVARFACIARLHLPSKGQDLLLSALSSSKWKRRAWTLDFYGEGPQRRTLDRLIGRHGLQDRVAIRGHTSDMDEVWQTHDLLLLPSRYEGMPLVLIEAMLSGRPSVGTDVGDVAELLAEGMTGFIAEAPSIAFLEAALERMWQARSIWPQIGRHAHQTIVDWLSGDPAEKFADLIVQSLPPAQQR